MRAVDVFFFLEGSTRSITFHPQVAKMLGGCNRAIFFLNLIQWLNSDNRSKEIYKTAEEIERETALSTEEQSTARKHLKSLKLLRERHARLEHRIYYSINFDALNDLIESTIEPNRESGIAGFGKPGNPDSGSGQSRFRYVQESTAGKLQEKEEDNGTKAPHVSSPHRRGEKLTRRATPPEPEPFTRWYEAYPRREARVDALKAWIKLDPNPSLIDTIMAATVCYAEAKAGTERQYIKQPSSWLNGRRWEDDLQVNANGNGHAKPAEVKELGNGLVEVDGRSYDRQTYERRYGQTAN